MHGRLVMQVGVHDVHACMQAGSKLDRLARPGSEPRDWAIG